MPYRILTGVLICALAAPASATVLVPASLNELAHDATIIARGQVVAVDGRWTDDRRTVETIVTLETESYLKGRFGQTLQFRVPGGTLGRFRNIVMGAPRFDVGQRVIVFLGVNGPRVPYILGLNQGVYRVQVDDSGRAVVTPPPIMPGVVGPVTRGASNRQPAPLDSFEREIRAVAGGVQ
jgi:hypothetical protein